MSCIVCGAGGESIRVCGRHARIRQAGYIAMIEALPDGTRLNRTLYMAAHVWPQLYPSVPAPEEGVGLISTAAVDYIAHCMAVSSEVAS